MPCVAYGVEVDLSVFCQHLFKGDWKPIHKLIEREWAAHEPPVAYIRDGDAEEIKKAYADAGCKVEPHPWGYRSVHHVIRSAPARQQHIIEIQVRTIFEEGWSEIDHRIRYPRHSDNAILNEFIRIFNRFAGTADEMGTFVAGLNDQLREQAIASERIRSGLEAKESELAQALKKHVKDAKKKDELLKKLKEMHETTALAVANSSVSGILDKAMGRSPYSVDTYSRLMDGKTIIASAEGLIHSITGQVTLPSKKCAVCGRDFSPVMSGNPETCPEHRNTFVVNSIGHLK